jgi:hypothetical protein
VGQGGGDHIIWLAGDLDHRSQWWRSCRPRNRSDLAGREVVALTEETADIRWPGGSITTYRKNNKPAFGPLGDSLEDLQ